MTRGSSAGGGVGGFGNGIQEADADDKFGKKRASSVLADLRGDHANVALLLLLYTLQGVPMGLAASVPLLLQERGATYSQQSLFSFVSWPFSLKLLWAPLVDGYYSARIGRRRSWLLPAQMLCALLMISSSSSVDFYLGDIPKPAAAGVRAPADDGGGAGSGARGAGVEGRRPAVYELTCVFFVLYLLMATQDIAVDGWALTMLQRRVSLDSPPPSPGPRMSVVDSLARQSSPAASASDGLSLIHDGRDRQHGRPSRRVRSETDVGG